MLTVPVLPCPTQVIVPWFTLPVVITATGHHTDGCQPGECERRALVDNHYTHTQIQLQAHALPLSHNDKRQHTQSWGRQRASWSMNNCSPRQQTPVQLSWGIVGISHRVTQFHHVSSFAFLLYHSPSSPAHHPEFTQIIAPILKFSCKKEILTSKYWSPSDHR